MATDDNMGKIINTKRNENGRLLFEVEIDHDEAAMLGGDYDTIHLFSERVAEFKTNISSRGKNASTKYFLVPRHLRRDLDFNAPVSCQKIDTEDKIVFIYVVDKNHRTTSV